MELVIILAFVLRLLHLDGSFWLDEAAQALEALKPWSMQLGFVKDFQPPLLHVLLKVAITFGKEEWWLRGIGALIPGLLTIWMTMQLGERLFNKRVAVIAGLFLATDSFHIFYSQELRPYSLAAMLAVISWWCLVRAVESKKFTKYWLWFMLTTIAGFFSTYLYPFVFISQVIYVCSVHKKHFKNIVASGVGVAVVGMFWLPTLLVQLKTATQLGETLPGWTQVVSFAPLKAVTQLGVKLIYGVADPSPTIFWIIPMLGVLSLIGYASWLQKKALVSKKGWVLFCFVVVPVVVAAVVSVWVPLLQPKRILFVWPGVMLFLALLIDELRQRKKVMLASTLMGVVLIAHGFSIWQYATNPLTQRENWRELHAKIVTTYPAYSSVVIFSFDEPFAPWSWYDDGQYPILVAPVVHITEQTDLRPVLEKASDSRQVLMFDYLRDLTDPQHRLSREIEEYGFIEVETVDQPLIGFVRVFMKPEAVLGALPDSL